MTEQEKAIISLIEHIINNSISTTRTNDIFSKQFIRYLKNIIENIGEPTETLVLALVGAKVLVQ